MNYGYAVAGLGVLGIIVGAGMYAAKWHHTIGEGGIGLGVVLLIVGIWYINMGMKKPAPAPMTAAAPQPATTS